MARYDFWTHGTNVVAEHRDRVRDELRWGFGSRFEQDANSENWFHFPIPAPTVLDDDQTVALRQMRVRGRTNENARVAQITAHQDNSARIHDESLPEFLTGIIDYPVTQPPGGSTGGTIHGDVNGSLVLCLRVEFLTGPPRGQVEFFGAGALYTT